LILFFNTATYAQTSKAVDWNDLTNPPLLFLGNNTLPPMIYMKDDKAIGIIVDIAEALKTRMARPVRLEYMNWSQAQQFVLEGKADALLQINPSDERNKIYDFSNTLMESEFSIFIPYDRDHIYDIAGLKGFKVGVEERGLPIQILKRDPLINIVVIPDIISGFHLLTKGAVEAVVVDRWVGSFVLAENNLNKIRIAGNPIEKSYSAIAVRKGNTKLLIDINKALAEIKADGTYSVILSKWKPKEIVFQTRDQFDRLKIILTALLCVLFVIIISGIFLLNEINKRKKIIGDLEKALSEVKELSGLLPICSYCKKIRDDKGYWNQLEAYIHEHSKAEFSHSICQECAKKYYPDMDLYSNAKTQQ
jgi:ABC-type amino acid transport substrate-binding protein